MISDGFSGGGYILSCKKIFSLYAKFKHPKKNANGDFYPDAACTHVEYLVWKTKCSNI